MSGDLTDDLMSRATSAWLPQGESPRCNGLFVVPELQYLVAGVGRIDFVPAPVDHDNQATL